MKNGDDIKTKRIHHIDMLQSIKSLYPERGCYGSGINDFQVWFLQ